MPPHGNMMSAKAKNFKGTAKRMIADMKGERLLILFIIFLSMCSAVLSILSPLLLKEILSNIMPSVNPETGLLKDSLYNISLDGTITMNWGYFCYSFGLLIGIYIVSALLTWLSSWLSISVSSKYAYDMRCRVQRKFEKLPLSYFDKIPYGDTLSIGTNDVDNISRNMQDVITSSFSGITLFIGVLIAMFVSEWRLALVAIASLPLILIAVIVIAKFSQKQFKTYRAKLGVLNGKVQEAYTGYKIIKLFNKEQDFISSFNETNEDMAKADRLSQFLSGIIMPATTFINNLGFVAIAVVAGIIEESATMIVFFLFLNLFTQPFRQIGQLSNIIQSIVASGERIYELLDAEEQTPEPYEIDEVQQAEEESKISGNYSFENVAFSYVPEEPLIEDMNLKVNAGDTIAIVGPTGAGKTTLVNLIMRFYDINDGSIKLDDKDLRDINRKTVRGIVGMVLQDTWLFRGTIRDNITYGAPDSTEEEIISACKEAHIYHFIKTLPGGFDFMLNEEGNNISQGQKQLVTIARAILSKPKVMILDEATSSVDTRTEQQIQDAMNKIMVNRTSFIIAHRLSTIKNAKLIIVMNKGHIIETGNHQELIAKNGFYADLYNSQFLGTIHSDTEQPNS